MVKRDQTQQDYEAIFREMLEGFALHEIICDDEGRPVNYRFLSVNPAFERITGLKAGEIVGRTVHEVLPGMERYWIETYGRVALTGEPVIFENYSSVLDKHFMVTSLQPAPNHFACVFFDITERKRSEEALLKGEKLYRSLFEYMINGFAHCKVVLDQGHPNDLIFLEVNRNFQIWTGLKDVVGKKISEVIPGIQELDKELFELFGRVTLTGNPEKVEIFVKSLHQWFLLSVYSYEKEHFEVVFDVITEHKKNEEALLLFKKAIEGSSDAIGMADRHGNHFYQNKAFTDLLGYTAEELHVAGVAQRIYADQNVARDVFETIMNGGSWSGEVQDIAKDGRGLIVMLRTDAIKDETGNIIGLLAINTDITERKQAELEKEHLQERLNQAQKMESVGRLAGGVAHDFNNMLSVILGHTEMAMGDTESDQPLHAHLLEIRKAAERSADLTRQLLAFARKQTVSPRVIDMNQTVEGMLKMLQRLIGEDIHLSWLPGVNSWPVKIDPSQVDQILANLCVNARDAITGVGKVTIELENIHIDEDFCAGHPYFISSGDYILLAVSDDGHGMDREVQDRLFEPFFTTKEVGKGTGLGLATVYGIVKQNKGFINVYSEPGHGTTFRIYLPRHLGDAEEAKAEQPQGSMIRGHETVLVVEDELAILDLCKIMLEQQGYEVLAAATPGEAIQLAGEHSGEIHLLITDMVMPGMNGRDLAKRFLSVYPAMKCLFMSGYTANMIVHQGILDEGVYFIQKPFSRNDLTTRVREVLDHK